jgi:hypothetical protein
MTTAEPKDSSTFRRYGEAEREITCTCGMYRERQNHEISDEIQTPRKTRIWTEKVKMDR